jgi:hypothetical protein
MDPRQVSFDLKDYLFVNFIYSSQHIHVENQGILGFWSYGIDGQLVI